MWKLLEIGTKAPKKNGKLFTRRKDAPVGKLSAPLLVCCEIVGVVRLVGLTWEPHSEELFYRDANDHGEKRDGE